MKVASAKRPPVFNSILMLPFPMPQVFVAIISVAVAGAISFFGQSTLSLIDERVGALAWTWSPDRTLEERVVIVAIDEKSIAEIGPWPWPREKMAELATAIDAAGARLQLHDIVYSEPRGGDDILVNALSVADGAVIAQVPILAENDPNNSVQDIRLGSMTHAIAGIECDQSKDLLSANSFVAPHNGFADIAKGHITPLLNADGSISKQPALICAGGLSYPSLAIAAFLKASESNKGQESSLGGKIGTGSRALGPEKFLTLDAFPGLVVPLDGNGNLRISYASSPDSFQAISAADVLSGTEQAQLLENAWVLVGATAFGLDDVVPTPYAGAAPGVELQARILSSILDVRVPYTPQSSFWILAAVILIYAIAAIAVAQRGSRFANILLPALVLLLPLVSFALHYLLLQNMNIWVGWAIPALFGSILASFSFVLEQTRLRMQRNRVLGNLASYLPSELAQQIAYSLPSSDVVVAKKEVTLLSADLRNFSAYSESRPVEESAGVLHLFFQSASRIVESFGGRIHEFKGDGILAIWDGQGQEPANSAYQAGLEILKQVDYELLRFHEASGLEPLSVGIGIEQGPALLGSIGPSRRRAQALLGATVSITIRIQEMTSDLAQPLLLGAVVARQLDGVELESQGSYLLVGLKNPHVLFAPAPPTNLTDAEVVTPRLTLVAGGRN